MEECFLAGGEGRECGQGQECCGEQSGVSGEPRVCLWCGGHGWMVDEVWGELNKNSVPRVSTAHCSGERRELFFCRDFDDCSSISRCVGESLTRTHHCNKIYTRIGILGSWSL